MKPSYLGVAPPRCAVAAAENYGLERLEASANSTGNPDKWMTAQELGGKHPVL